MEHVEQFASKAYRYRLMFVMALGNFINAFDRASLSIAVPFIMREFNIDTVAMGMADEAKAMMHFEGAGEKIALDNIYVLIAAVK